MGKEEKERKRKGKGRGGEGNESDLIGVGSSRVVYSSMVGLGLECLGLAYLPRFPFNFFSLFFFFLFIFCFFLSLPCRIPSHRTSNFPPSPSTLVLYRYDTGIGTGTVMNNPQPNTK